ncbi:MAG: type IV pili twitching motility protein PilT, partial [Desulfuromonadales bacterium]|nr:type IV pili twitching motility protein PilT [Desulfuromonadales bacterium]NIS39530.1 type IV pili twitching motility protein PilT [Desulfuromonadales bacterium]
MNLTDILGMALKARASDIHLKPGLPPVYRIDGTLRPHPKLPRLNPEQTNEYAQGIMNDTQKMRFEEVHEVDLSYGVPGLGRFRVNA